MSGNSIEHHYRLKKPCANCPFKKEGAIDLAEGRVEGIANDLMEGTYGTFQCHKTVHTKKGGEWNEETGEYESSGHESMCAGAAAYLMRAGNPTHSMRFAIGTGHLDPDQWNPIMGELVEPFYGHEHE